MAIELFRPSVPPLSAYQQYLEMVERNRMYSNFGPLHDLFRERLASHFEVAKDNLELFANGTMALIAALEGLKKNGRPYCLLPSWTFVATTQAVVVAGLVPIFVDVDLESMQVTSSILDGLPSSILDQTSVVLVVSPFGAPLNLNGLKKQSERFGFEVLCDCAAGFESIKQNTFHNVISLHATKTFGIGEGGLLLSNDFSLLERAKSYSNFGFMGSRQSIEIGINAKLSEFHAAVGLGAMDVWHMNRQQYYQKAMVYLEMIDKNICLQEGWGVNWISSNCVVKFENKEQKNAAQSLLKTKDIQSRDWWNQGCHQEPVFKKIRVLNNLDNTRKLAEITLGIPFYRDIDMDSIKELIETLNQAV